MSTTIAKPTASEADPTTAEVAQELYIRRGKMRPITCQLVSEDFSIDGKDVNSTALHFRILVNDRKLKQSNRELGDLAHDWHFDCEPAEWIRVLSDPATNASPREATLRRYRSLRARRLELEELAKQPKPLSKLIPDMLRKVQADRLAEKRQRLGRLLSVLIVTRDSNLVGHIAEAADDLGVTDAVIASRVEYLDRCLSLEETYKSLGENAHDRIRSDYARQIAEKASALPDCYDRSTFPPTLWRTV